jgi:hydrogenase maturation protease
MKIAVLCFGSEFIEEDKLGFILYDKLKRSEKDFKNIDFFKCSKPDEIFDYPNYDKVIILDVVQGLSDITLIQDINILKKRQPFTLHDFDLNFFIQLMKETGEIKKIKNLEIIGIPIGFDKVKAENKIKNFLKNAHNPKCIK